MYHLHVFWHHVIQVSGGAHVRCYSPYRNTYFGSYFGAWYTHKAFCDLWVSEANFEISCWYILMENLIQCILRSYFVASQPQVGMPWCCSFYRNTYFGSYFGAWHTWSGCPQSHVEIPICYSLIEIHVFLAGYGLDIGSIKLDQRRSCDNHWERVR